MASLTRAHKGDVGRKLRLNAGENITTASLAQISYKKPSGVTGTWAATIEDLTYASYTTISTNDLDETGNWEIQLYVEMNGAQIHGALAEFHVYRLTTD